MQLGSNIIAACGISGPSRNKSKLRLHDAGAVAKCSRYLYVALHTKKKEKKKMLKGRGGNLLIHFTAIPYRASTRPVQGQKRVFPVSFFPTGKTLFSLQGWVCSVMMILFLEAHKN